MRLFAAFPNTLLKMLDVARAGDVIVVWRLDRLGRSLKQLIETVTMLGERGIELRSLKENIDTTTSTGKLMFHIIGAMAEFERDVRSRAHSGWFRSSTRTRQTGRQAKGNPENRATQPGTRQRTLCSQAKHHCRNHADDRFQKQKHLL
jgi:DNA invertase Pin-like site-specific DNA recombinase